MIWLAFVLVLLMPAAAWAGFPTVSDVTESQDDGADTTMTYNYPATVAAGDLLILVCAFDTSVTSATNSAFTELFDTDQGTHVLYGGYRIAVGTEDGTTFDITAAGAADQGVCQVIRIAAASWHGTQVPEDNATTATGSGQTPDPPSATASWGSADNLFIAVAGLSDQRFFETAPSNYVGLDYKTYNDANSGGNPSVGHATRELASDTDDPGTFDIDNTAGNPAWTTQTIVIRGTAASTLPRCIGCGMAPGGMID